MTTQAKASIAATVVLLALMCFQVLLAVGLPLGNFAWGGQYGSVLPAGLRWASLVAVIILGFAAWAVLARADLVKPGAGARSARVAVWIFAAYFVLNTVMNVLSKSPPERYTMTPVSTILVVCFIIVARSRSGHAE